MEVVGSFALGGFNNQGNSGCSHVGAFQNVANFNRNNYGPSLGSPINSTIKGYKRLFLL